MKLHPKVLTWLVDALCPSSRPDLKGDFLELYEDNAIKYGSFQANKKLMSDVLSVIPLRFIMRDKLKPKPRIFMLSTNLKIAKRNLFKNKLYSIINVSGLSISLAACLLITLFVRDELSFDKHFAQHEGIFRIAGNYNQGAAGIVGSAATTFMLQPIIQSNLKEFEHMTRVDFHSEFVTVDDKDFLESSVIYTDSTFFKVFPLPFIDGNPFTALDNSNSVVLDKETAQKYFGKDKAIGKPIEINGKTFTVTGVIAEFPANSHFTARIILPIPGVVQWYPEWVLKNITGRSVYTYVRGKKDFDRTEFESSLNKSLASHWSGDNAPAYFLQPLTSIHLTSHLQNEISENGNETTVYIFSITALVILILACINYINLSMAGSLQRTKEVGMKKVLGSTTGMQVSQFQTESLMVVVASAILALIFAKLLMPFLNQLSGKVLVLDLLNDPVISISLIVVVFVVGMFAGSFPALILLRVGTMRMLSGNLGPNRGKTVLRNSLIVFQFTISIALIASTLIVMDQIGFVRKKNLGINPEQVVMIPLPTYEISRKYDVLKDEMMRIPGVASVTASSSKVTNGVSGWRPYRVAGAAEYVNCPTLVVAPEFFETMEAEILQGRSFSKEYQTDSREAYIVNESAVKFFELERPIGTTVEGGAFNGSIWNRKNAKIIGIVKDFHLASLHSPVEPLVFSLASEITMGLTWMEVRITSDNVGDAVGSMERLWSKVIPERAFEFEFMNDALHRHYQAEDQFMKIFMLFSVLSVLLGCLGLFGLTAFMTKRRTKEIGIRKVIGASTGKLIRLLSRDFLKLVAISNLIGSPIAWYLMNNWLNNFAYQTIISVWIFVWTGVAAIVIAFVAILYHALKASRANPVTALKCE